MDVAPGWQDQHDAILLGRELLVKQGDTFLLGPAIEGRLPAHAVRFVFGAMPDDASLGAAALCCHRVGEPAVSRPGTEALPDEGIHLDAAAAHAFLQAHPDALLVDVRELAEHSAGAAQLRGRAAHNVPLSQLAGRVRQWLDEPRALVFVCRSGNRSARAARLLRRLGHAEAWHLAGGLALAG
jgi:rhodanese-related sulfurtransferase